jgi:general secretion pathway protein G
MNKRSGFTLIELMIVVIIMAALAGMVLPRLLDRADDAKKNISRGEIASITTALKFYKLDNGAFPGQEDGGLKALMTKPKSAKHWKGPYLEKDANDPWGRPYQYKYRGDHNSTGFDLWSTGLDEGNGEDDVNNWETD